MLRSEEETTGLILRIQSIESKVGTIEEKVELLLEQGEITQENVTALTDSLHEQKDHFAFMRHSLLKELARYRRVFALGSFVLILLLMWILLRI